MSGNELYERMRMTFRQCGHTDVRQWDDLAPSIRLIWNEIAEKVTAEIIHQIDYPQDR